MKRILTALVIVAAIAVPTAVGASVAPRTLSHHLVRAGTTTRGESSTAATTKPNVCPLFPKKPPAGYKLAMSDNFNEQSLNSNLWFRWSKQPGGDPYGWWDTPSNILKNSQLQLKGKWVSSGGNPSWTNGGEVTMGVGSKYSQTYGIYKWCMKSDDMPGTSTIALLWPASSKWPPEVDYYETDGGSDYYAMTLHYGSSSRSVKTNIRNVWGNDATRWNVYTAIWTPGMVQIKENGKVMGTIAFNVNVPNIPMRFDIQTQAISSGATVGNTYVQWIAEYAKK